MLHHHHCFMREVMELHHLHKTIVPTDKKVKKNYLANVICTYPDCTVNVMTQQAFQIHFTAKHLGGDAKR